MTAGRLFQSYMDRSCYPHPAVGINYLSNS